MSARLEASAAAVPQHVVYAAPLTGVNVIEASAGTGKTWTIAGLYVRLLVEKPATVDQILAITFTIAAAAELRDRIRARVRDLLEALDGRDPTNDAFIDWMLARIGTEGRDTARRRLVAALRGFDEARISTIHGFCQRALSDHAFGSGVAFDCELLPDVSDVLHEVAADFWRTHIASSPAAGPDEANQRLLVEWLGNKPDLARLEKWAEPYLRREGLALRRPPQGAPLAETLTAFRNAVAECCRLWTAHDAELTQLLKTAPLNRKSYQLKRIDGWCDKVGAFLRPSASGLKLAPELERFSTQKLRDGATGAIPAHPFIDAVDRLYAAAATAEAALNAHWVNLRFTFIEYARAELARRLAARNVQSFDDLLAKLGAALSGPHGAELAATLRARCPYALIDEFQDTDPLQWRIFHAIYKHAPAGAHVAYLVGDPKQAIYSFRGADVYAYLAAAGECGEPLRLLENQRSVPGYVAALNAVFGLREDPFRNARIAYEDVAPSQRDKTALVENGQTDPAPLRIAFCAGEAGGPTGKGAAGAWAVNRAAEEIARLIDGGRDGRIVLGERALRAGDIAVLVNAGWQAAAVRQALGERGISSAELSSESVFGSREAEELERLLLAMAAPKDAAAVRAALLTDLIGLDAGAVFALGEEAGWEDVLLRFERYHQAWRDRGVMRALREAFRELRVHENLARYRDGERRLTNLYHLGELLNLEEQHLHGIETLVSWLAARRGRELKNEEMQLRLESDADLVQIVTIHRSKGLEYPVTFVPFLWHDRDRAEKDIARYHETAPPHALVLDAADPVSHLARTREEDLGERLRVAYVALTRAKNRCYLFTGAIKDAEWSPLGWLLHGVEVPEGGKPLLPGEAALRGDVDALVEKGGGAIAWFEPPTPRAWTRPKKEIAPPPPPLAPREFRGKATEGYALTSFSALLRALERQETDPIPDHDQVAHAPVAAKPPEPGGDRFAFPRGAAAGTCLHAILERADYAAPDWGELTRAQLVRAGYPAAWAPDVEQWLREVLATPLRDFRESGESGNPAPLRLSEVPRTHQLRELAFQLATPAFRPRQLVEIARRHGVPMSELPDETLRGYLSGYIDLAFRHDGRWYVADWKSNWLGGAPEHYGVPAVAEAMAVADYHLQYLLYTVALHRWLRTSVPGYDYERDFGGVRYLFLRGTRADWRDADGAPLGVFASRPARELIEALDACFGSAVAVAA